MEANYSESEIKLWLEVCLKNENIKHVVVNSINFLEKGEGCMGDVMFVCAEGRDEKNKIKTYSLALKCSKNNKILKEISPMKNFFINEIYLYDTIYPTFTKFQLDHGINNPFSSIPKYYGSFVNDDRQIIALEDLAAKGYSSWDRKKPMTRNHIDLIVEEYAKFHAIALAMKDQQSEEYDMLTKPLDNLIRKFESLGNKMVLQFCSVIPEVYELLREDLDHELLLKWKQFGKYMESNFLNIWKSHSGLKVVNHGDCWNNNFMFRSKNNDLTQPTHVSIIDWQVMKLGTPVSDLSHFLFTCISEEDIKDLEDILDKYYNALSNYLLKLQSEPNIYSKNQFSEEWRKYSKLGIMMTPIAMKVCILEKDEAVDIEQAATSGDFTTAFDIDVKNKALLKERMKHVVKYVAEHDLI